MSWLKFGLALPLLVASATASGTDGSADREGTLSVRPLVSGIPRELVIAIGEEATPTEFDPGLTAIIARVTPRFMITMLCGSVQPGYIDLIPELAKTKLDEKIGGAAKTIKWPACLRIKKLNGVEYVFKQGDILGEIKRRYTGDGERNIGSFFSASPDLLRNPSAIPIGTIIPIPYQTERVRLTPQNGDVQALRNLINEVSAGDVWVEEKARLIGQVIGPRSSRPLSGQTTSRISKCEAGDGSAPYPFDPFEVTEAYSHLELAQSDLSVLILDNGFFGAPCNDEGRCNGRIESARAEERFPKQMFYRRSSWGVRLGEFWASNYQNSRSAGVKYARGDADEDSGHGTHVAGLAIGGPSLSNAQRRQLFYDDDELPWLRVLSGNLSGGATGIPAGMETSMLTALSETKDDDYNRIRIVNLSVAFAESVEGAIENVIGERQNQMLFVVASGNDTPGQAINKISGNWAFPVAFGGNFKNLLTVASVDGPINGVMRISGFSNFGPGYVDIAAPGCKLESWLDAEQNPARLSGTSQAAPVVTFAATLLRSVWDTSPAKIRHRLMFSGDLLIGEDREKIRSQSRLNIAKALTYKWDRITFERNGVRRTLLGKVNGLIRGVICDGKEKTQRMDAYKRLNLDEKLMVFESSNFDFTPCSADVEPGKTITFLPEFEIDPFGRFINTPPDAEIVMSEELIEIISASE